MKYLFLFFILIVYIYSITFVGIPISAKIILEGISLIYCVKFINGKYRINNEFKSLFPLFAVLLGWDIFVCVVNGNYELYFANKIFAAIGSILTVQLIIDVHPDVTKNLEKMLIFIVTVILFESVLTLVMKIYPPAYDLMLSILVFDFGGFDMEDIYDIGRFTGIGTAKFFGVLPSCSIGLMSAMYIYFTNTNKKVRAYMILAWITIFIVSFFTARYTILVGAVSILYYLLMLDRKSMIRNITVIGIVSLGLWGAYLIANKYGESLLLDWAFGSFRGDGSGDHTTDYLLDWWINTRFEISTLLVGDGHYVGLNGIGYYKNVDIGIFRQIYYGGIFGLLYNLYIQYKILKLSSQRINTRPYRLFAFFSFLCYLAILTKGDANMHTYFILYLAISTGGVFQIKSQNQKSYECNRLDA